MKLEREVDLPDEIPGVRWLAVGWVCPAVGRIVSTSEKLGLR
jgi:hypothetical protein